jgi:hypothetical protein
MIVTVANAPVSGLVLTDIVPANTRYSANFLNSGTMTCGAFTGQPQFTAPPVEAGLPLVGTPAVTCGTFLPAGTVMQITFVVTTAVVTQDTVITNYFTVDVDQLLPRESNVVTHIIGAASGDIFLPIIFKNFVPGPDLAVIDVEAGSNGAKVVIKNVGSSTASPRNSLSGFWVDFYLSPNPIPKKVNDTWDNGFANTGAAWLYTNDIAPGEEVTLLCTGTAGPNGSCTGAYVMHVFGPNTITNYGSPGHVASGGETIMGHADSACTPQCPDGLGSVVETHETTDGAYNSNAINNFGSGTATSGTISSVSVTSSDVGASSSDISNAPSRP